uniref:tRNA-binding domain-containing protein n=1 Tax=Manihot esculenta TaxID=3983 RepID=A0A2C9VMU4_MANES
MAPIDESITLKRKQVIASALVKHLSLDPGTSLGVSGKDDIMSLYTKILKSSGKPFLQKENEEVMKWIEFAESFPVDCQACLDALTGFNQDLAQKSILLGNGTTPSDADVIVFSVIHSSVIGLSHLEREKLTHVMRWMDYIQHKEEFAHLFEKILLKKPAFEFLGTKGMAKVEVDSNAKKTLESTKNTEKSEADKSTKKNVAGVTENKEAVPEKKKPSEKERAEKDKELSVSLLNIQVGLIRKASKHPSADRTNRRVVLITNVKPGKLRDVMSEGLVLCASNEDHSVVEPLLPPEGAKIGERVSFSGIDGKPEDVLNPKKKQLEKITLNLFTDDKGVATFKGIPFMTSGGPCTSSIPKASIK